MFIQVFNLVHFPPINHLNVFFSAGNRRRTNIRILTAFNDEDPPSSISIFCTSHIVIDESISTIDGFLKGVQPAQ